MGMNIVIIITTVAALGGGIFAFWMDHCNKKIMSENDEKSLSNNETKQSQERRGRKNEYWNFAISHYRRSNRFYFNGVYGVVFNRDYCV